MSEDSVWQQVIARHCPDLFYEDGYAALMRAGKGADMRRKFIKEVLQPGLAKWRGCRTLPQDGDGSPYLWAAHILASITGEAVSDADVEEVVATAMWGKWTLTQHDADMICSHPHKWIVKNQKRYSPEEYIMLMLQLQASGMMDVEGKAYTFFSALE
eukprot:TRINITY_DN8805_c0_g1_i2.p1 TRINITY_DN8805_c0_g1~~TRINITY_DN8805_c0_g1_i2.p1  ORF type:complete len:157 (-),score=37.15 TRINITY_DN8805_c0_g1_i2:60-530(-)